jgi:AMP-binding enzyme
VAFLAPNIPALLEAHYGVPAAGGVLVTINTRLGREEVDYILKHSGARFVFADHELVHLVRDAGLPVIRIDDTGAPGDPYEEFLASGLPEPCQVPLLGEEQALHLGHDRTPEGRHVHAPRCVPELAGGGARITPAAGIGAAVGDAYVPLQRMVLHLNSQDKRERATGIEPA